MRANQKTIAVRITPELIRDSVKEDSSKCMIAQALRLEGAHSVHVTTESASFNLGATRYTYPLPARAAKELIQFDRDKSKVRPFEFRINLDRAYSRPVLRRPNRKKRGPTVHRKAQTVKRSKRRFHGLRIIEVSEPKTQQST